MRTLAPRLIVAIALSIVVIWVDSWLIGNGAPAWDLGSLLATVAEVSGVFLGLYFTAVSVVASTGYADVPADVRALLTREKVGNVYLFLVAMLTAYVTALLAANAAEIALGTVALVTTTVFAVVGILSFVTLGLRAFYFFDAAELTSQLISNFMEAARSATPKGYRWEDSEFQVHYQRQGQSVLRTLERIIELARTRRGVQPQTLRSLGTLSVEVLEAYASLKQAIPDNSHWFVRVARHRSWITASEDLTSVALATDTPLLPEAVPDSLWVEREIERILRGLLSHLHANDVRSAAELLWVVQAAIQRLARSWSLDEAVLLQTMTASFITPPDVQGELTADEPSDLDTRESLEAADAHYAGVIGLILGVSSAVETLTGSWVRQQVDSVDWRRMPSMYSGAMPSQVKTQYDHIRRVLEFESKVEGDHVTQGWYVEQIVALGYARWIDESLGKLLKTLQSTFPGVVNGGVAARHPLLVAQALERGLESCHKLQANLNTIRESFDSLEELRRMSDVPWPAIEWDAATKRIRDSRQEVILAIARLAPVLSRAPRSTNVPDYFGHSVRLLGEECFDALANGQVDLFSNLFAPYFYSCLTMRDRAREELARSSLDTQAAYSTASIMDLLDISGYAFVFSGLLSLEFGERVRRSWDRIFDESNDPRQLVELLFAVANYHLSTFGILPGDLARTRWKQRLESALLEAGLLADRVPRSLGGTQAPRHPDRVIDAVTRVGSFLFASGVDVFLAVYLMNRPEATGLSAPAASAALHEIIAGEE